MTGCGSKTSSSVSLPSLPLRPLPQEYKSPAGRGGGGGGGGGGDLLNYWVGVYRRRTVK